MDGTGVKILLFVAPAGRRNPVKALYMLLTASRKASKNAKKKNVNIICRELYHESVSAFNETAPTLSRALSFQSFFMAAFSTDLVAIFNEEYSLLLRKLFLEPLCMRGRRPRSKCNGWEEKQEMAKIGLLCIVTAARISRQRTDILCPKLSRSTLEKDFFVVHFHQIKKHLWTFKAPILLAEPWRSVTEYLQD